MRGTKERILDVAEELFSEKGFNAVGIREISKRAECNVSAINYYFGNKENLYLEVFKCKFIPRAYKVQDAFRRYLRAEKKKDIEVILRSLVRAFIEGPFTESERIRHARLMSRELTGPSIAMDMVVNEVIRPFVEELSELLTPHISIVKREEDLLLDIISILLIIMSFNFSKEMVRRITGSEYSPRFKKRLIEHIVRFVKGGLLKGESGD